MAIIEDSEHYHMPIDTVENLNLDTAWHYLTKTLSIADYVANNYIGDLQEKSQPAIFFMFFPNNMIIISYSWAYAFTMIGCLFALVSIWLRHRRKIHLVIFSNISLILLSIISLASLILFIEGSYLIWFPMLIISLTELLDRLKWLQFALYLVAIAVTLILWVPLIYFALILV